MLSLIFIYELKDQGRALVRLKPSLSCNMLPPDPRLILVGISFQLKLPLPKESNQEKLLGQLRKDREGPSQDGG